MAKRGPKPKVKVEEVEKEEPRKRIRGDAVKCPDCDNDMFVETSRSYPEFMRVRHYKCGACGLIKKMA